MRLDKFIADSALVSRREARELIRAGRVLVNGVPPKGGDTAKGGSDRVTLDGRELAEAGALRYFMLNKPEGCLSATEDSRAKTVLDLLPPELRRLGLFPVGRLDKDTRGLLILTNDGAFAHRVTSPASGVEKLYEFFCEGEPDERDAELLGAGVVLGDGLACLPARLVLPERPGGPSLIAISEGKYHQVKRMLASLGKPVTSLKRLSIGALRLDESLRPGEFKELTPEEAAQAEATDKA